MSREFCILIFSKGGVSPIGLKLIWELELLLSTGLKYISEFEVLGLKCISEFEVLGLKCISEFEILGLKLLVELEILGVRFCEYSFL